MLFIAFGLYGAISYILNNLTIDSDPDEDAASVQGVRHDDHAR